MFWALVAVEGCRSVGKKDMIHNSLTPDIRINPETYEVKVDGKVATAEPAASVPMGRLYNLF